MGAVRFDHPLDQGQDVEVGGAARAQRLERTDLDHHLLMPGKPEQRFQVFFAVVGFPDADVAHVVENDRRFREARA